MQFKINLEAAQVTEAIEQYVQAMGLSLPISGIKFKGGRKGNGTSAIVEFGGKKAEAVDPAEDEALEPVVDSPFDRDFDSAA